MIQANLVFEFSVISSLLLREFRRKSEIAPIENMYLSLILKKF